MLALWNTVFYEPLYNGLIFLIGVMPAASVGLAIISLTVIVRLLIFPFTHKSIKTQMKMRELEPEIQKIREKYPDKQEQAKQTMELYRKHGTNPFSGCLTIFIQLPIFIALFLVFRSGFAENADLLYSFVSYPDVLSSIFLGIDLHERSVILAVLVGVSQYVFSALSVPKIQGAAGSGSFQQEFARGMNMQIRYFFPVLFTIFSLSIPSAVALYWVTSNMFSIGQELLVRRMKNAPEASK